MSKAIKIRKGLNIRLKGKAETEYREAPLSEVFAIKPTDFVAMTPKMVVKEGEEVKAGQTIFYDKYNDRIKFSSPVSGEIAEIVRGAKRRIMEVRILADKSNAYESFPTGNPNEMSREEVTEAMLSAGVWPLLRQRPFSTIANPDDTPKAIVVPCTDTHPLAPDNDFIIKGQGEAFQAGLDALNKLTDGVVHLTMATNGVEKAQEFIKAHDLVNSTGYCLKN